MANRIYPSIASMEETVFKLADTYGLYAYVYQTIRKWNRYIWSDGSFHERKNGTNDYMMITLQSPEGLVGQAFCEGGSQAAMVSAFHLARRQLRKDEYTLQLIRQLEKVERKLPPLLMPADHLPQELPKPAYPLFETQHQKILQHLPNTSLTSTIEVVREYIHTLRSDGTAHSVAIGRLIANHQLFDGEKSHHLIAGYSSDTDEPLLIDPVLVSLAEQFARHQARFTPSKQSCERPEHVHTNSYLLMDASILARFIFAALQISADGEPEHARNQLHALPLEGTPGFTPLHPLGFLLPPGPLLTQSGIQPGFHHFYQKLPFLCGGHFSLHLPILATDDQISAQPEEIIRQLQTKGLVDEEAVNVLEGIDSFHFDAETASYALLPKYSHKYFDGLSSRQSPFWIYGRLDKLLSSAIGGFGPIQLEHDPNHPYWTVGVPAYAFLSPDKQDKEFVKP